MNVYDSAHNLARALKESEDYKKLLELQTLVNNDPQNKKMFIDFRKAQWELQKAKALGKEISAEQLSYFDRLAQLVQSNPSVKELIAADFNFSRLMSDIQKILINALHEWSQMAGEVLGEDELKQ